MSDLAQLKEQVDATINLADERRYFGASVKYQRALEAEVERLEDALEHWQKAFDRAQTKANTYEDRVLSMSADVHALEAEIKRLRAALAAEKGGL